MFPSVPVGLSDHSKSIIPPVMSVALGGSIIETHFMLDGYTGSPDAAFSLTPVGFAEMIRAVRDAEASLGDGEFKVQPHEEPSLRLRRSLFAVKDIKKGDIFTKENVRSIRPNYGLHPENYYIVLNRTASRDISRGEPLKWNDVFFRL
jgi:sialic acid synthase SpsE